MQLPVTRAVNRQLNLLNGLSGWSGVASALREPPLKFDQYPQLDLELFVSRRKLDLLNL